MISSFGFNQHEYIFFINWVSGFCKNEHIFARFRCRSQGERSPKNPSIRKGYNRVGNFFYRKLAENSI